MTATAADALTLLAPSTPDTWPAGILAAADLRQARAEAAQDRRPGPYVVGAAGSVVAYGGQYVTGYTTPEGAEVAEHIAAEANPAHALAAVRHWRSVAERHVCDPIWSRGCQDCRNVWPCEDVTEVADEARAYLRGSP